MCYLCSQTHTHTHTVQNDKGYCTVKVSTKPDRTLVSGKLGCNSAVIAVKERCGPGSGNQALLSPPHWRSTERMQWATVALSGCHEDLMTSDTSAPLFMLVTLPGISSHVPCCLLKSKSFHKAQLKYHLFCEAFNSPQFGIHSFFLYTPTVFCLYLS